MENNLDNLVSTLVSFFGLMGTLIGVYYIVVDVLYTGLQLFNPWPSDRTRLKTEFYSLEEIKKNTFYFTVMAIFIALLIGFYCASKVNEANEVNEILILMITFIILGFYLLIMLCIQRKRNKKVLTVNYRCKTWYLLFSTDEGFVFSTSKKQREYNQDLHELQYFKKDQIFKHFSGYVDISKDDSKKD